ncbi:MULTISPECIES: hypothetical protein [Vibrio harveyi group]|uniref:hypothetical protein n=1 Tax=Vibrio harveyi group TaxID=717610 RepID=UPI001B824454|nr:MULTISPECIES: hypothetical protein [Vibrio harveyi group]EGQ8195184.1 hypothetical protein [Vibrio parahaemolyticus]MBS9834937.1 hypothetical protein [Vibrio alginolyticus]WHT05006.1 hypothetical protein O2T11_24035 [Vibrio parahaemolyticus]HBC3983224.1 hypothetical protein [Vibrio parahaemolyticus]
MKVNIFEVLLVLTLLIPSSDVLGHSFTVQWVGEVVTIDTPQNLTLRNNWEVVWETNGKENSLVLNSDVENELSLVLINVASAKLISYNL